MPLTVELLEVRELGPCSYRWPDAVERFDRCWELVARVDGETLRLRHALGEREAYGRRRARSVTFVRAQPVVEGVGADDHASSRALLSLIKGPDRRMVRHPSELPPGYGRFPLVDHASEIRAPWTRRALAVKVREDDLEAWAALAALRMRLRRSGPSGSALGPPTGAGSGRPAPRRGTVDALGDLRDRMSVERFAGYLRSYERSTGDDRSLERMREEVGGEADLGNPEHRDSVVRWLRGWGCRHLRVIDHERTTGALGAWWTEARDLLPPSGRDLVHLDAGELRAVGRAFGALRARVAASRDRRGTPSQVTFGPTAAAKTLFAVRPRACPPWDAPIRRGLGFGDDGGAYRRFLEAGAEALRGFSTRTGIPLPELPSRLGRPR
ncbi:MAG TPA: hypothetical protein VNO79_02650, partial [Actinomycetota bacterium]|nr:hypothetical protein [Actinomycetota bacterium]